MVRQIRDNTVVGQETRRTLKGYAAESTVRNHCTPQTSVADIRRTVLRFRPSERGTSEERDTRTQESRPHHYLLYSQHVVGRRDMRQHSTDKPLAGGTSGGSERSTFSIQNQYLQTGTAHRKRAVCQQHVRNPFVRS